MKNFLIGTLGLWLWVAFLAFVILTGNERLILVGNSVFFSYFAIKGFLEGNVPKGISGLLFSGATLLDFFTGIVPALTLTALFAAYILASIWSGKKDKSNGAEK